MVASGPAVKKQDRAGRGVDAITEMMQAYADRGAFRGFGIVHRRDRVDYRFMWLTIIPTTVSYEAKTQAFTFRSLLPAVPAKSQQFADVKKIVDERLKKNGLPAHRRIDPKRAKVSLKSQRGAVSLQFLVQKDNHQYAVEKGMDLVNEVFVMLHAGYPEYLHEHFKVSNE